MSEKDNQDNITEEVKKLTQELDELQSSLKTGRDKVDALYLERRGLVDQRRSLRRQKRDNLLEYSKENVTQLDMDLEALDNKLDIIEKDIEAAEREVDRYERAIEDIEEELEDLMDGFESPGDSKSFNFTFHGKDIGRELGRELGKAYAKLSEINFDQFGENIGKTVDKAVAGFNRSVTDFMQNVKHDPEKGDYFFAGAGSLPGGTYGRVSFSGSGSFGGDVKCDSLKASGSLSAAGSIDCAGEIRTSGSVKCNGDMSAGSFKSSGSVKLGGGFTGDSINVSGSLTVGAGIKANTINVSGSVTTGQDCEAETFYSSGKLNIAGLLNADIIEIHLNGIGNSVSSIGCETITVTRRNPTGILNDLGITGLGGSLKTDSIEGDILRLENTTARIVRGRDVYIGNGCNIEVIEYSNKCEVSGNSTVGDTKFV